MLEHSGDFLTEVRGRRMSNYYSLIAKIEELFIPLVEITKSKNFQARNSKDMRSIDKDNSFESLKTLLLRPVTNYIIDEVPHRRVVRVKISGARNYSINICLSHAVDVALAIEFEGEIEGTKLLGYERNGGADSFRGSIENAILKPASPSL